ncbi:hypothetical protein KSP35_19590 [Aquihabitans sp. G128]|jgi:hypothetical protein|uniref:hypothetical protein n=1 Tax=Aquihabitans sp. G128 TaxID=2849779 RepID=UPI001C20F6AC|nr:hypothetical protein [Aquihabitans sp. G128]QXC60502.1 hypothetical protein KSP35_19590 [Aquihabitans sp. G128]HWJ63706.1 hypothetical protein [Acidimicrobiales bacterium]
MAAAQLVADGQVRLVLTRNFDQLIERAIEAARVRVQVISTSAALEGSVPLVHAAANPNRR